MQLIENWRQILWRAWSVRLLLVAMLLSAIEVVLPLFVDAIPRGIFAIASAIVTFLACGARIVAQNSISGGSNDVRS